MIRFNAKSHNQIAMKVMQKKVFRAKYSIAGCLPEEEAPGCVPLLRALLLGVLLTLGDGVHHVVAPATQARHLAQSYKMQGNFRHENWRESNFVFSSSTEILDEPYSAKPAQLSSHTGPPGYTELTRYQPM